MAQKGHMEALIYEKACPFGTENVALLILNLKASTINLKMRYGVSSNLCYFYITNNKCNNTPLATEVAFFQYYQYKVVGIILLDCITPIAE